MDINTVQLLLLMVNFSHSAMVTMAGLVMVQQPTKNYLKESQLFKELLLVKLHVA